MESKTESELEYTRRRIKESPLQNFLGSFRDVPAQPQLNGHEINSISIDEGPFIPYDVYKNIEMLEKSISHVKSHT